MSPYPIPCPHEGLKYEPGELPTLPDFHPLRPDEVSALLAEAILFGEVAFQKVNAIQIRLCQAIPGYECPRAINGPVADAELVISHFYCEMLRGKIGRTEAEQAIRGSLFEGAGVAIAEKMRIAVV